MTLPRYFAPLSLRDVTRYEALRAAGLSLVSTLEVIALLARIQGARAEIARAS